MLVSGQLPDKRPEAFRQDYSDASQQAFPRRELVYAKRKWLQPVAQNLCLYSDYTATHWTASDGLEPVGNVSVGVYADRNRASVGLDNTVTENGVTTWYQDAAFSTPETYDLSSYEHVTFSVDVGHYRLSDMASIRVYFYVVDGTARYYSGSYFIPAGLSARAWVCYDVAAIKSALGNDASACGLELGIVCDAATYFYWQNFQLEANVTEPGLRLNTAGCARIYLTDTVERGIGKVHTSEVELVQEEYEGRVTPREGHDQTSFTIPVAYT